LAGIAHRPSLYGRRVGHKAAKEAAQPAQLGSLRRSEGRKEWRNSTKTDMAQRGTHKDKARATGCYRSSPIAWIGRHFFETDSASARGCAQSKRGGYFPACCFHYDLPHLIFLHIGGV